MPPGKDTVDELQQLRRCIRDLVALSALPAIWRDHDARQICESLAETLVDMLHLEFVYVSVRREAGDAPIDVARAASGDASDQIAAFCNALGDQLYSRSPGTSLQMENPIGSGIVDVACSRIGITGDGLLVAASRELPFPSPTQRLLLGAAANQLAIALQRRAAEDALRELAATLETRVAERTRELEAETVERERAEAAFRQAQRMEAIGELTGGVAHDFNNLLMVIEGSLESLRRQVEGRGADRQLDAIARAARRGEHLTRQLLTFARRQPLRPVAMDLREDMPKLIDLIGTSLRGDIEVETRIAPDLWPIEVDPSEFELALLNIVLNARDAMPKGGRLILSARNRTLGSDSGGNDSGDAADLAGDFVEFTIADTGEGIPAAVLPRVFEPFYTTKEVGRGTGLGLSQVYGFAKQTGGGVTIASESGVGTTVRLLLPRSVAQVPADAVEPPRCAAAQSISTILLVEDNDEVADVTTAILEDIGYHASRARNAGEALTMLSNGGRFHLLLSDIVMPGGTSGLNLARIVRQRFPAMPILLTTGYSAAARQAVTEGLPILQKPYRRQTLESAVRQFLEPGSASGATVPRSYWSGNSVVD